MALADRQYMQTPVRRNFAHPRPGSLTSWLIFLNVLVYVVDKMLLHWRIGYMVWFGPTPETAVAQPMGKLEYWGYFSATSAVMAGQIWRFVTFQFLHANFDHLLFNMLTLYFFAPIVEMFWGARQFLVFYLLCGVGGAAMYLLLLMIGFRIGAPYVPLIGASAGIFGVLIAATRVLPDAIALVFGVFPMRLRLLVWLFIAYAVFQVLFRGNNAGGEAAHLGGAAIGFLLMQYPQVIERIAWLGKRAPPF